MLKRTHNYSAPAQTYASYLVASQSEQGVCVVRLNVQLCPWLKIDVCEVEKKYLYTVRPLIATIKVHEF